MNTLYPIITLVILLIGKETNAWSPFSKKTPSAKDRLEVLQKQQIDHPLDPIINYNLGVALFRDGKFKQAADNFKRTLDHAKGNVDLIKRSYFNSGNCNYKHCLGILGTNWEKKEIADDILQKALVEAHAAVDNFKNYLVLDPEAEDRKKNLELSEKLIQKIQEKMQKQQQQKEQDDKNKENKKNQDQQKQDQQHQSQDQQNNNQQSENKNTDKSSSHSNDKKEQPQQEQTDQKPGQKDNKQNQQEQQKNTENESEQQNKGNEKEQPQESSPEQAQPQEQQDQQPQPAQDQEMRQIKAFLDNLDQQEQEKQKAFLQQQMNQGNKPEQHQKSW